MYLVAPITLHALESWPAIRRLSSIIGLIVAVTALVASSFAKKVWQLILTQGVLYAIGGSMLYSPTMFYLDEWFVKRKGLAFGIMWAGVGTVRFSSLLRLRRVSNSNITKVRSYLSLPPQLSPHNPRTRHHPPHLVRNPTRSLHAPDLLRQSSSTTK